MSTKPTKSIHCLQCTVLSWRQPFSSNVTMESIHANPQWRLSNAHVNTLLLVQSKRLREFVATLLRKMSYASPWTLECKLLLQDHAYKTRSSIIKVDYAWSPKERGLWSVCKSEKLATLKTKLSSTAGDYELSALRRWPSGIREFFRRLVTIVEPAVPIETHRLVLHCLLQSKRWALSADRQWGTEDLDLVGRPFPTSPWTQLFDLDAMFFTSPRGAACRGY